jgi:hypothetical protein
MSLREVAIGMSAVQQHARGASLTLDVLAGLLREGVDMGAIMRRVATGSLDPPRLDRVIYTGTGFEFVEEGGRGAMTFVVRDEIGDAIDLCAWSPPRAPALWCARGALLGGENLFAPRIREGLEVCETPLQWLRGACRGVVVLDWVKAAPQLRRAQPLQAASVAHGLALRDRLTEGPLHIIVPSGKGRTAA